MSISNSKLLIHDLVDTNPSTFSDARMIRGMNKAQNKVVNIILQKDTLEQWDDNNYDDLAEGFIDLNATQNDYDISEDENFAKILCVSKIFIKESATATDYVEVEKAGKFFQTATGVPSSYRISGRRIIFDNTPNYTAVNGIKILFTREPKPILISDTTREMGIPSTYHHLVELYTAFDYARAKNLSCRDSLKQEILEEEVKFGIFIEKQSNETVLEMSAPYINAE